MTIKQRWRRGRRWLEHDLWRQPTQGDSGLRTLLIQVVRVVVLALRGFATNEMQLRASALTYYSLLSLVPALALAFGIAKGFGLEAALEESLRQRLAGQEATLERVIDFSRTMLASTRGGVVAGAGVAVLLWSVIRLLGNIEASFNVVWGVDRPRSAVRKLTDYLAIAILAPLLLLTSSSATVLISGRVNQALAAVGVLDPVSGLVTAALEFIPFVFVWVLLTLLYLTMPNTAVSWRAGVTAGVVTGTLYQVVQFGYVQFVVNVARYNAVYGSFAALPLFLIWVHLSWLIILMGAEVSFAVDNAGASARERVASLASHHQRRLLGIRLAVACAERFRQGQAPATASDLAGELGVSVRLVRSVLNVLVTAGVLVSVQGSSRQVLGFQPARDPAHVTIVEIARALDRLSGRSDDDTTSVDEDPRLLPDAALGEVGSRWRALEHQLDGSADNLSIAQIAADMNDGDDDRQPRGSGQ